MARHSSPRTGIVVAIEGGSGVGKTALVADLAATLGWTAIPEASDLGARRPSLRFRSDAELARREAALFARDLDRWRRADRDRAKGESTLLDTGPFGTLTYTRGLVGIGAAGPEVLRGLVARGRRAAVRRALGVPDLILYLEAPPTTLRRRAAGSPGDHPPRLTERHHRVGRVERRLWLGAFRRQFPRRLLRLDADRPAASVRRAAERAIRRAKPLRRAGPAPLLRWLEEIGRLPGETGNR
ncbi:MAG: AAA family ATPase [Thermoplasmata archaeon]